MAGPRIRDGPCKIRENIGKRVELEASVDELVVSADAFSFLTGRNRENVVEVRSGMSSASVNAHQSNIKQHAQDVLYAIRRGVASNARLEPIIGGIIELLSLVLLSALVSPDFSPILNTAFGQISIVFDLHRKLKRALKHPPASSGPASSQTLTSSCPPPLLLPAPGAML